MLHAKIISTFFMTSANFEFHITSGDWELGEQFRL